MIQTFDNYINSHDFETMQQYFMGEFIPWSYNQGVDFPNDGKFQFVNYIYYENQWMQNGLGPVQFVIEKIKPLTVGRIKANLLVPTPEIVVNDFHTDMPSPEKFTTAIFYINDNDGYTEFEDGTIIESVANRMVIFPSHMKHRGTSATTDRRVLINFNFISQ
jgi:hypothetical protein